MNRLLKGAIAGAAGVALLLGGAGTFALWNSTATVAGGTIVAGELKVTPDATVGAWTHGGVSIDMGTYRIVPGDVLVYTKDLAVTATGDNLNATLGLGAASITASSSAIPSVQAANDALAGYLNANAVVAATGAKITGSAPTYSLGRGPSTVTVTVTITFPSAAANDAALGSVNLNNLTVTLNQV
jgi:alternate signal-mediated exported protein